MWGPVVVAEGSAEGPLSLADAKLHLRVDGTTEDTLIQGYLDAAVAHVEAMTGLKLAEQTVVFSTVDWNDLAALPVAPITDLTIAYVDSAGAAQDVAEATYETRLEGLEPAVVLAYGKSWPANQPGSLVSVAAEVGYANCPPPLLQAVRLVLGDLYNFRESTGPSAMAEVPSAGAVEALVSNYRRFLI